jgi:hypothetical protein
MSTLSNAPQLPRLPRASTSKYQHRRDLAYALAMVIGMIAREIGNSIAETGMIEIQLPRLIGVLIWAPILYVAIFTRLRQRNLSLLGLALTFQLGFFWTSILQTASGVAGIQHMPIDRP